MTVKEIANIENVAIHTVRQWIRTGKLKANCNSKGYDITISQYDAFCSKVLNGLIERRMKNNGK